MSPSLTAEARFVARERLLRRLILEAGREHPRVSFTLRGVRVIPDYRTGVTPGHVDVHVDEGVIADILPAAGPPSGEWVVGGLVDSHVHTHGSERQTILHLINGVTGVREMCGFDWMPERRERIASGLELGPRMFVAGHILASHPMDGFATVVESVGDVWREVEAQRAAGFEAIKVHNRLDLERYDAAASAAKANGLPLVGHVPHGVPVEHALASGQTTIEHLKGFYQDWDLQLGQGDWAEATRLSSTWNCPTLVLARVALTGPEAKAVIESARGLWDPMLLEQWSEEPETGWAYERVFERSREILPSLLEVSDRWLAGTDAGGGERMLLPGDALHREIAMLEDLGLPREEALHAATHAVAQAHPGSGFASGVTVGQPADLLLVDADPRSDASTLRNPIEVVVGGRRLSRGDRSGLLRRMGEIGDQPLGDDEVVDLLSDDWGDHPNELHRSIAEKCLGRALGCRGKEATTVTDT